jgi:AraC family transcriptional regulator of adaptative response/methylated-DNA-[protein]-cysteine methyltransferase
MYHYTLQPSPLGQMLVAGSDNGIGVVFWGDDEAALEAELRRTHGPELARGGEAVTAWAAALVARLNKNHNIDSLKQGPNAANEWLALPLDLRGTTFQRRVWQALRCIPVGQTRTYAEVAGSLSKPHAARAVARACASNPLALLIPCHRVVRSDGRLGGYRWGLWRKGWLLCWEQLQAARGAG